MVKIRKLDEICTEKTWHARKKWLAFLKSAPQNYLVEMVFEPGGKIVLTLYHYIFLLIDLFTCFFIYLFIYLLSIMTVWKVKLHRITKICGANNMFKESPRHTKFIFWMCPKLTINKSNNVNFDDVILVPLSIVSIDNFKHKFSF